MASLEWVGGSLVLVYAGRAWSQAIAVGQPVMPLVSSSFEEFPEEEALFELMLPDLLENAEGQFAVLKGSRLVGTWPTLAKSELGGRRVLGNDQDFLIKPVQLDILDGDIVSHYVRARH